jgi:hypothetical protein
MESLPKEQRLVSRVLRHWVERSAGKRFPSKDDIDFSILGDDRRNCMLVRIDPELERSSFVDIGENLFDQAESLKDSPIAACPRGTLLGVTLRYLSRFRPDGGPLSVTGSAPHLGEPVLFRSVLLPLGNDGASIDHILGAVNFRALRPGEDKQLRARLEVLMLKIEPGQIWDVYSPLLGGWVQAKVTAIDGNHATLRQKGTMQTMSLKPSEMTQRPERYRFISYS